MLGFFRSRFTQKEVPDKVNEDAESQKRVWESELEGIENLPLQFSKKEAGEYESCLSDLKGEFAAYKKLGMSGLSSREIAEELDRLNKRIPFLFEKLRTMRKRGTLIKNTPASSQKNDDAPKIDAVRQRLNEIAQTPPNAYQKMKGDLMRWSMEFSVNSKAETFKNINNLISHFESDKNKKRVITLWEDFDKGLEEVFNGDGRDLSENYLNRLHLQIKSSHDTLARLRGFSEGCKPGQKCDLESVRNAEFLVATLDMDQIVMSVVSPEKKPWYKNINIKKLFSW